MSREFPPIYGWRRLGRAIDAREPLPLEVEGYLSPLVVGVEEAFHLASLDDFDRQECVVLLGESGIGKSHVLRELQGRITTRCGAPSPRIELATVTSYSDLRAQVTDALTVMPSLGDEPPTLFLDDLEHCPLAADLEKHLGKALERVRPLPRLRLAARSGAWTPALRARLTQMWGDENVRVYELCPLIRREVVDSFAKLDIDADLVAHLDAIGAGPLLARPLTLLMVLDLVRDGQLPNPLDRRSLYRRAMRRMVNPAMESRSGQLDTDERLAIARRIAAVSVFCNRQTFRIDGADARGPTGTALTDLATGVVEPVGPQRSSSFANTAQILEVLRDTALFNFVAANEVTWRHTSFAEFLAAEYVQMHGLGRQQLRSLLSLDARDQTVPIVLEGVAGWIGLDDEALWSEIVRGNPVAVLRSDVAALPDGQRAALAEALFDAVTNASIGRFYTESVSTRLRTLAHPGLAEQIRARLRMPPGERAMSEIISVATLCRISELAGELAVIALDAARPLQVRDAAARAVAVSGDHSARSTLRALLDDAADRDDQLLGHALAALWPEHLTTPELMAALRPPRNPQMLGAYAIFLHRLAKDASMDLGVALEWARHRSAGDPLAWDVALVDGIVERALVEDNLPAVLPPVIDIFRERRRIHAPLLRAHVSSREAPSDVPTRVRRALLRAMASSSTDELLDGEPFTDPPLLRPAEDLPWLMEEVGAGRHDLVDLLFVALGSFHVLPDHAFDALWALADADPDIRERSTAYFSMEISSPIADRWRKTHEYTQRSAARKAERLAARDQQLVERSRAFVGGDVSSASWLAAHLGAPADDSDAWRILPLELRDAVGLAAIAYLERWARDGGGRDAPVTWMLKIAATRGRLDDLAPQVWRAIVLGMYGPFERLSQAHTDGIRAQILVHAPAEVRGLIEATDASQAVRTLHWLDGTFEKPWPEDIVVAVANRADVLAGEAALAMVHEVFESSPVLAEPLAHKLAASGDESVVTNALALLVRFGSRTTRERVWARVLVPGSSEGRAVTARLADAVLWHETSEADWEPRELADLYLWLRAEYPLPGAIPGHVRDLMEAALEALLRSDAPLALTEAERMVAAWPDDEFLRHRLHKAKRLSRSAAWRPLALVELFLLVSDRDAGLVNTNDELLDAVVASLDRLQLELQGETGLAATLWNDTPHVPKHEERLSDLVKRHLDTDLRRRGVIANREVEVRQGTRGMGPKVDVHVDAVSTAPRSQRLTVICEVKRCAHTAWDNVDGELGVRYLRPGVTHGVFILGYYGDVCPTCRSTSIDQARATLETRALALSPPAVVKSYPLHEPQPVGARRGGAGWRAWRTRRPTPRPGGST